MIGCDRVDDVGGFGDQRRALLDQIVGAGGARIERRAGHGKHLAALFGGHPRGDQRARAVRGLDDDDAEREAPEISRLRRGKSRARGTWPSGISEIAAPLCQQRGQQILMLGRIDPVVAAGQHRDRAARDAGAVRGLVDAAREPGERRQSRRRRDRARVRLRISAPRRRRCASRRSRSSAASARPACRARRAAAARRRAWRAAADSRLRPARAG